MQHLTTDQFQALRLTMPWTERMINVGRGTVIQIVDKNGAEVPLLTITAFLRYITPRIAAQATAAAPIQPGATPA
jgi:hypothetical protein